MIRSMTLIFTKVTKNYLPDAYIFALVLTLITFMAGIIFKGQTPVDMAIYWGDGFWNLMTFAMQMALVLVFGFTLAKTYTVHIILTKLTSLIKTQAQAVLVLTLASCLACYINWGFGLIVSALLAVEFARKLKRVNYGLLIASAYSGFLVWHGGLSGSIPLKLTNPNDEIKALLNGETFSLSDTIFSPMNLIILFTTIATLLILNTMMSKGLQEYQDVSFEELSFDFTKSKEDTLAKKLETSRVLNFLIVTLGLIYLFTKIAHEGIGLNTMIMLFMVLALILHGTPRKFLEAFNDSVRDSSGILLQFPFYAGIMAMMSESGLAISMSEFFISISTENTFLFFTYISAGVVNFFVPSGGGQWALQAPIILPAAKQLGVSLSDASMAIAWGDAWTNMVQPFWALPLLSAAKCDLKQMMSYSVIIFLATGIMTSLFFVFYSMLI
jgi:short-chain fatty acids transporter